MTDLPTVAQELERKSLAELERVMHGLSTRKVSLAMAHASLQSLWAMCSGLVPKETMELIAQSATAVEKKYQERHIPDEIACVVTDKGTSLIMRHGHRVTVRNKPLDGEAQFRLQEATDKLPQPELWASNRFHTLTTTLETKGTRLI